MAAKNTSSLSVNKKSRMGRILFSLLAVVAVAGLVAAYLLLELEKPRVSLDEAPARIGVRREIGFNATDRRSGIRSVEVRLLQDKKDATLFSREFPRQGLFDPATVKSFAGTATIAARDQGFVDGAAELVVAAHDFSGWNWLAGNRTEQRYPVTIDTAVPKIALLGATRYINTGGSGVVVYTVDEAVQEHGVRLNDSFHPGYPLTDREDGPFVAYVGLRYDTDALRQSLIRAVDAAGNEGEIGVSMVLRPGKFKKDRINVDDGFLGWKLPEFRQYYSEMSGTPVEQYLFVNNTVRHQNNEAIARACSSSSPKRLWQGRFHRMAGSNRAGYADHRTYYYQDEEIDRQVHLGMDIASTSQAEVRAANHGIVVLAEYLGIYGNTVILDHGQGVFTLYSHLSRITVNKGDLLPQDGVLGASGTTGMAGGDHLHFSVLINGVFVNPLEWWDPSWLENNIEAMLPPATAQSKE